MQGGLRYCRRGSRLEPQTFGRPALCPEQSPGWEREGTPASPSPWEGDPARRNHPDPGAGKIPFQSRCLERVTVWPPNSAPFISRGKEKHPGWYFLQGGLPWVAYVLRRLSHAHTHLLKRLQTPDANDVRAGPREPSQTARGPHGSVCRTVPGGTPRMSITCRGQGQNVVRLSVAGYQATERTERGHVT